ncbi:ion transporter [Deinococcus peraridilitoris]|uniref:Kef-type K+ ransport system, predicted NAD-binding component n=1 Tax=Deinococcus peraridilitoris (strain DSM 19664 / LMG 22246 / CIP 109416 / KR-200) TaxID=937777 RepID=L0A4I0_DEIPD|nr:ion transporter [Deinococcus peraridilitoris]AFZ68793.1 Kef-type K+ ransport system, predicted NAD-binding component [Deinococcus peraridilitoris DSM 19664]
MNGRDTRSAWRRALGDVIFGLETPAARAFDVALIWLIFASVLAVMFESVPEINQQFGRALRLLEWFFTAVFTIEYLLRLLSARRAWNYVRSYYGLIDLLSILPSYLSLLVPGGQYLLVVRALRLLRMFRVFKMLRYLSEANVLGVALRESQSKITVFLVTVLTLVTVFGTALYLIEGPAGGFTSIPISIYWAVVTLATVGYGDIVPQTWLGKLVATLAMLLGYAIIAVPTGIVTVSLARAQQRREDRACEQCHLPRHESDAVYCRRCGALLPEGSVSAP